MYGSVLFRLHIEEKGISKGEGVDSDDTLCVCNYLSCPNSNTMYYSFPIFVLISFFLYLPANFTATAEVGFTRSANIVLLVRKSLVWAQRQQIIPVRHAGPMTI